MRRKFKRFGPAVAMLVGLALVGTACSSAPTGGDGSDGQPVTLKVWINGTEAQLGEYLKTYSAKYEEENSNITIDYKIVDWATANQQLLTAAAGGQLPDVATIFSTGLPPFADKGLLLDVKDLVDTSVYSEQALEMGMWQGELIGLPWIVKSAPLAVRTDLAKEVGLDPSNLPETWDELEEWAKKLTVRDGNQITRVGYYTIPNHVYKSVTQFSNLLWSNGGRFFSSDGCEPTFNGAEGVGAAEFLNKLLNVDKVDFAGSVQAENTSLGQGQIAMTITNIATRGWDKDFPELLENDAVGFAMTPTNGGNKSYMNTGGNFVVVTKDSKNPKEAAAFAAYLTGNLSASSGYASTEEGIVPLKNGNDSDYAKNSPFMTELAAMNDESGAGLPKLPEWDQVNDIITTALASILLDKADAQKSLDDAASQVAALLAKSGNCAEETPNK